jgi:sulfide dehydrogenase cytochrome subunit
MKKFCFSLIVLPFFGMSMSAGAADLASLTENCDSCHGANGSSEWSDMPTIAGIDAFVHSEALFTYRDNARPCSDSEFRRGDTSRAATNMCALVQDLADEDIDALAEHYAALPFVAAAQEFDVDLASAGEAVHNRDCGMCHSDGGSNAADEASILAGQWMGYLKQSFADYRSGDREQPPMMQMMIKKLSEDDVQALVNYYASQQ